MSISDASGSRQSVNVGTQNVDTQATAGKQLHTEISNIAKAKGLSPSGMIKIFTKSSGEEALGKLEKKMKNEQRKADFFNKLGFSGIAGRYADRKLGISMIRTTAVSHLPAKEITTGGGEKIMQSRSAKENLEAAKEKLEQYEASILQKSIEGANNVLKESGLR